MSDLSADLVFDNILPVEVPVSVAGKKYVLREASGDAACRYRNALLKSTRLGPEGKPSVIDGLADVEPLLVSLCLFEVLSDGTLAKGPVPAHVIRSWPARIQKALFERAKQISDLEERETAASLEAKITDAQTQLAAIRNGVQDPREQAAKNSRGGSGGGSA